MSKTVGTLKEIDARFGDEVENTDSGQQYRVRCRQPGVLALWGPGGWGVDLKNSAQNYRIVARAARPDTPKLWRDMTPEEKGALLLAHHEGKVIEAWKCDDEWVDIEPHWTEFNAYRVKPEPTAETVTLQYDASEDIFRVSWPGRCQIPSNLPDITFNLIDGKPDPSSIRMEEL